MNVGQMYTLFAEAVNGGRAEFPTFETALRLHRVIDAIRQAAETGRTVDLA
jgi:predicted dehydrogenase